MDKFTTKEGDGSHMLFVHPITNLQSVKNNTKRRFNTNEYLIWQAAPARRSLRCSTERRAASGGFSLLPDAFLPHFLHQIVRKDELDLLLVRTITTRSRLFTSKCFFETLHHPGLLPMVARNAYSLTSARPC